MLAKSDLTVLTGGAHARRDSQKIELGVEGLVRGDLGWSTQRDGAA